MMDTGSSFVNGDAVEAMLTYTVANGERPVAATAVTGKQTSYPEGAFEIHNAAIRDLRPIAREFSLDDQGFALVEHDTQVADFYDETEIRAIYYREVELLIASLTGATRLLTFDHTLRHGDEEQQRARGVREPVSVVHNDYTDWSGPERVRDLVADEAEILLQRRFAIVQVWRPIQALLRHRPLAICDARTIAAGDLIAAERRHPHRVGEIYHIAHSDDHRWYYVPNMKRTEALVFKTYESDVGGRARFTAHASFDDPLMPIDAPPRESIEVRVLAFFGS